MTRAFEDLALLVVIEPAMTEAARLARYVLRVPVGYEKWEASTFPKGYPEVYLHLRAPVLEASEQAKQECLVFYEIAQAKGSTSVRTRSTACSPGTRRPASSSRTASTCRS
jgi:formate dehydrogenase